MMKSTSRSATLTLSECPVQSINILKDECERRNLVLHVLEYSELEKVDSGTTCCSVLFKIEKGVSGNKQI